MVLIAGDLFHENKPSRRTMYTTMEIIRRYCMGPNPVRIQIISDQATNFRSVYGTVNHEDQFYSIGEFLSKAYFANFKFHRRSILLVCVSFGSRRPSHLLHSRES